MQRARLLLLVAVLAVIVLPAAAMAWQPQQPQQPQQQQRTNAELAQENAELRQKLTELQGLEEDLMAKRVFEKSKGYLFGWIGVGGFLLTLSGIVGIKAAYDYMKSLVAKKVETLTQDQLQKSVEEEGKRLIAVIVQNQTADLDAYARTKIEQIIIASKPIKSLSASPQLPAGPRLDYAGDVKYVRDSGPEGSAVGQALAAALDYQIFKSTGDHLRTSARHIYYLARVEGSFATDTDAGAIIKDGIKALSTTGAVDEDIWPYHAGEFGKKPPAKVEHAKKYRITDSQLLAGLDEIRRGLQEVGPVVAGITLFASYSTDGSDKTGIFKLPKKKTPIIGGHALCLVGYDDDTRLFKCVNSWGTSWGAKGFGFFPYDYVEKYSSDVWSFRLLS